MPLRARCSENTAATATAPRATKTLSQIVSKLRAEGSPLADQYSAARWRTSQFLALGKDDEPHGFTSLHHLCEVAASTEPTVVGMSTEAEEFGQLETRKKACASVSQREIAFI